MNEVGEAELLKRVGAGAFAECSDAGARRPVAAALLRRCCLELRDQIDPRGLRLRDALVVGELDLAGIKVPFPLRFDRCHFDSAVMLEGAELAELAFTRCARLPGLLGNGLRVARDLDLSGSEVSGAHRTSASTHNRAAVWLCESDIGGRLLCVDTVIRAEAERSLQADRMHVGGTVRLLHGFAAQGEMRLIGAHIDGSLDLTGAQLESATGLALDLGDAVIGGSMFIVADRAGRRPVIRGRVDMGSAHISGQFLIRDAAIEERAPIPAGSAYSRSAMNGTALNAPRLSVGADVTLEGSCLMTGGIDLSLSEMSRLSIQDTTALRAAGRTALDLTNAELRSALTLGSDVTVEGALHLEGATVHGNLTLQGVTLTAPERGALVTATGLRVDGDVELQKLHATGGRLRFGSTTTLGSIIAAGAQLTNAGGEALSLHQATIKGSVIMAAGFRSAGQVVLSRAAIGGRLQCARGQFTGPGPFAAYEQGHAIKAISATIGGGIDLRGTTIEPSLDFTDVTTTVLADDQHSWPPTFMISGLTYERFAQDSGQAWDWAARCAWLSRQHGYDAGPYEQAARVFRQHGYPAGAEEILMAQRRQARRSITGRGALLRRARDAAYGLTVGYGYRPGRVLWLLAALLILVTVSLQIPAGQATMRAAANGRVYISGNPQAATNSGHGSGATCASGEIRCFSAPLYAIDTVIPLISLDQRSTWYPDRQAPGGSFMQWWLDTATLLGWLLSSIFVLSLARLARTR